MRTPLLRSSDIVLIIFINLIKRVRITVPCNLQEYESNYIKHLLEAYSENLGHQVTEINITGKYEKHLSLS